MFFMDHVWYTFSIGLGVCTNNWVEFMALKLSLIMALQKYVQSIQVYGDSKLVIDYFKASTHPKNIAHSLIGGNSKVDDLVPAD